MSTSLDTYPNSYDLQAIEPIEGVLISYFCKAHTAFEFQEATLEKKKELIRSLALVIDRELYTTEKIEGRGQTSSLPSNH